MHRAQEQVVDFHRVMGQPNGEGPSELPILPSQWDPEHVKLYFTLIDEETTELQEAINHSQVDGIVRELCDILYVTYGFANAFGIDLEGFFDEVHRTNMMKARGPKREDGKQLKPEGWEPPRIGQMLNAMYNHFYPEGPKQYEDSTDQSDLQSRVLSLVKDSSGPSSFVPGSEVHGLLPTEEG